MSLYRQSVLAWGACLPNQLKMLTDRSDEAVMEALKSVLEDIFSETWTYDAKIAWALMQGRNPNG